MDCMANWPIVRCMYDSGESFWMAWYPERREIQTGTHPGSTEWIWISFHRAGGLTCQPRAQPSDPAMLCMYPAKIAWTRTA